MAVEGLYKKEVSKRKERNTRMCSAAIDGSTGGMNMDKEAKRKHNRELIPVAKELRRNMTKEERRLWYNFLSKYPIRFYRQKILGKFVADFYCFRAKLVIELDGAQHYEEASVQRDKERTAFLERYGLTVIRIPNNEVNQNFQGVCEYIDMLVRQAMTGK